MLCWSTTTPKATVSLSANGNGILGGNAIIADNNVQGDFSGSFNGNGSLFGDAEIKNNTVLGDGSAQL